MTRPDASPDSLLLIDPILRGSRLHYTWLAAQAFPAAVPCILTRTGARTDAFAALFADRAVGLEEVASVPEGFWYGKIPPDQQQAMWAAAGRLDAATPFRAAYAAGVNELYPEFLAAFAGPAWAFWGARPLLVIEYDAGFLLRATADRPGTSYEAKRDAYFRALRARPGLHVGILDERVFDPALGQVPSLPDDIRARFVALPDPMPPSPPTAAPTALPTPEGPTRGLLIGLQSRRKGLSDVLEVLRQQTGKTALPHLLLSGHLDKDMDWAGEELRARSDQITWRDAYVDEAELQRTYAATDYVLLPYARDFFGSSGVMAYATAHGKPMITTDHGCIGYRIRHYGLGLTYPSGDPASLAALLTTLPGRDSAQYRQWQENGRAYAAANAAERHIALVRRCLEMETAR